MVVILQPSWLSRIILRSASIQLDTHLGAGELGALVELSCALSEDTSLVTDAARITAGSIGRRSSLARHEVHERMGKGTAWFAVAIDAAVPQT